jgi:hypothetical protein
MSQDGWPHGYQAPQQPYPYPYPYPQSLGFDPSDPLISNDFNGWWHRGFQLVKAAWRPMAVIQAIVGVPALILLVPAMVIFQDRQRVAMARLEATTTADEMPNFGELFAGFPLLLAGASAAGLFYLFGQLACQQVVVDTATGRPGGRVGPALLAAARRFLPLLGWYLLALPIGIVATVLCFFPVIYVAAALAVLPVVVLLERGKGIGRSFQLFHADLGVSVSRIATFAGLSLAGGMVLTLLTTIVDATIGGSFSTPNTTATVINTVLQGAYYVVAYPILAPLLVTTYADMRARREQFSTASLVTAGR